MKVLLATACGGKKNKGRMAAIDLYKSSRIKAVHNRRGDADFAVLSAKYGLIPPDKILKDYQQVLDSKGAKKILQQVIDFIRPYDIVIFFKGGSRIEYREVITEASNTINKSLILIGNRNQEDIGKLEELVSRCINEKFDNLKDLASSIEIYNMR